MASTIKARFQADDGQRAAILERARLCARLTKPWVLPPLGQPATGRLPDNYQSDGSRGVTNLSGKMLLALFPPGEPFARLTPIPEVQYDPRVDARLMQHLLDDLSMRDAQIQAQIESCTLDGKSRQRATFRSRKRAAIEQLLITGDVLEQFTDDYRLKVFRRDRYVTKRDSCGDVLYHIIRETVDPLALTPRQRELAQFKEGFEGKPVCERMQDLYTLVEWNPLTRVWVITQEVNDHAVNESQEEVTPFFSTPFDLVDGEDSGRGFIEANLGDLGSLDELCRRLLDFAEMSSKMYPFIDGSSQLREQDFEKPTGSVMRGSVRGGQVDDVAFLKVDKLGDFNVCYQSTERIGKKIGAVMLMESETAPQGEAGRHAYAWQTVVGELNGALGGLYAPIADEQQVPLLRRVYYQMERDLKFTSRLPKQLVNISALTGFAAVSRSMDAQKIEKIAAVAAQLVPPGSGANPIDAGVAIEELVRLYNVRAPGLVKSPEQLQAETQQAIAAQTQLAGAQKALDTAGNIVQSAATQGQSNG